MAKLILVLAAAATAVLAQNFSGEPSCAIPCLTSAIMSAGCDLKDQGCACSRTAAIEPLCVSCLFAACDVTDISKAAAAGSTLCSEYSKSHGLPPAASATATEDVEGEEDMEMTIMVTTTTTATTGGPTQQLVTVTKGGSTVTMEWSTMTMGGSVVTTLMPCVTTTILDSTSPATTGGSSSTVIVAASTESANAAATTAAAAAAAMGAGAFAMMGLAAAF